MSHDIPMDFQGAAEALRRGDADLRIVAARALGSLDDPRAIAPLADALDDPEPPVAVTAAIAMTRYGASAVEALFDVLRRRSRGMVLAERCLVSIEGSAAILLDKLETASSDIVLRAATLRILAGSGDVSIVTLVIEEALEKGDAESEYAAAEGIKRLGRQLEVELLGRALLYSVHDKLSEEAGRAMARRSDSVCILFTIAVSRRLAPARCAFEALVSMKGTADETLLEAFREGDAIARATAARVLAARGETSSVSAAGMLDDIHPIARPASLALTISAATDERLEDVLEDLGSENDPEVLLASARALIEREATSAAVEILERVMATADGAYRHGAAAMLSCCGLAGLEMLVNVMKSCPQERWTAALSMGDIEEQEVLPELSKLLDGPVKCKWAAAYLLSKTLYAPAVAALREALSEGDTKTRRMAVEALVGIGGEGCEQELARVAELDPDPAVRLSAAMFAPAGSSADVRRNSSDWRTTRIPRSLDSLPGLLEYLASGTPSVRASAAFVLGRTGRPEAAWSLYEALFDEDKGVALAARRSLDSLPVWP
jgi:HEAT repeat protein